MFYDKELFHRQIRTLQERDCPKSVIDYLKSKEESVAEKMYRIKGIVPLHIPFIAVVPRSELGLDALMKMVCCDRYYGHNFLDQSEIRDMVSVREEPYFIYDVESGRDMIGKSPSEAEVLIKEQGRSCLTIDEGIALSLQTNVLLENGVDCMGSYLERDGLVPNIYLGTKPLLSCRRTDVKNNKRGSPSCVYR